MCRFLIYSGHSPILLSHLITSPTHSILTQSYDSRLRLDHRRPHNGDGFGVGYYTASSSSPRKTAHEDPVAPKQDEIDLGPEPCIFTSTIPAWNCATSSVWRARRSARWCLHTCVRALRARFRMPIAIRSRAGR